MRNDFNFERMHYGRNARSSLCSRHPAQAARSINHRAMPRSGEPLSAVTNLRVSLLRRFRKCVPPTVRSRTGIHLLGDAAKLARCVRQDAFWDLGIGLMFAAVFVYMLMVVNYQNFGDPFDHQISQAEATLGQLKAAVQQAQADTELAR
jgi:hypothetical protein